MKKFMEILLIFAIVGLISGRLLLWYGANHNGSLFFPGFFLYALSFFGTFLFASTIEGY